MALGPGRYDDLCTYVRTTAQASGAIVIVLGGNRGPGFAVQTINEHMAAELPELLRLVATSIERDVQGRSDA